MTVANAGIFIGWGQVIAGRENKGLQVFGEAQAYYQRLQDSGTIESFEPVVLQPHGGDLIGFILLRGDRDKLDALRQDGEFQMLNVRAGLVVANLGIVEAAIGDTLAEGLGRYAQAVSEIAV